MNFPGHYFGRADLPVRQSLEALVTNAEAFEEIRNFSPSNRYRKASRPVGRLDVLYAENGREMMITCTAWLIASDKLVTNRHCLDRPGRRISKAALLMNYLAGGGRDAKRFTVNPAPLESDAGLDYAVLRVSGNPTAQFGTVKFRVRDPVPGEELFVIHHPAGKPKRLTRFKCRRPDNTPFTGRSGVEFLHSCATLGGSSGSPIFSDNDMMLVGLHFAGSDEVNHAKRLVNVMRHSRILDSLRRGSQPSSPKASLTVQTVPAEATIRIETNPPGPYRDGLQLQPGNYRVTVEASGYERFQQRLEVNGPNIYQIALCKLESRTQQVCENKNKTEYRMETRKTTETVSDDVEVDFEDLHDALNRRLNEPLLERLLKTNRRFKRDNERLLCALARDELLGSFGGARWRDRGVISYLKRKCRELRGTFIPDSLDHDCKCDDLEYAFHGCEVTVSWDCRVTKRVRVPYSTVERECRNEVRTFRSCPDNIVTRLR